MNGSSQFYCKRPLSGTNKQRSGPRISEVRNAAIINFVSNLHDPGNISISNQSCQKASERQILLDRINCIEQMATESLTSWELLEAKIFLAPDMLMHSCAYTHAKYNKRCICKDLIHPATITIGKRCCTTLLEFWGTRCFERRAYDLLHTCKIVGKVTAYCTVIFLATDPSRNSQIVLL